MQTDHIQPAVTVPMSKPSAKPKSRKTVPAKPSDYNEVLTSVVEVLDAARRASARVVNSLMTATY
jgi:hypothetical protein